MTYAHFVTHQKKKRDLQRHFLLLDWTVFFLLRGYSNFIEPYFFKKTCADPWNHRPGPGNPTWGAYHKNCICNMPFIWDEIWVMDEPRIPGCTSPRTPSAPSLNRHVLLVHTAAHLNGPWRQFRQASVGALLEVKMSKKWKVLWREAHFKVKMRKALQTRSTLGNWGVEEVHAVVARRTFRSQNGKTKKQHRFGAPFGSWEVQKVHAVVAPTPLWSENVKNTPRLDNS